ncbi:MAG: metallophosphoesterase family protein [Acidimicrobiales bacterium]
MARRATLPDVVSNHLFLQLSDLHIVDRGPLPMGADPLANLDLAIDVIEASPSRPDGFLLTGDLADSGTPLAYSLLRGRIERLAGLSGAPVVVVPGNHDDRAAFRLELLGSYAAELTDTPIDQVHWFRGLRVISLDTVIPAHDGGTLREAQLRRLRDELATPARDGTILAMHHPPVASPIRSMAAMALDNPDELAAVIEGTDVCLIVAGHNHHASAGMLGRIPVWVGPALSYRSDPLFEDSYKGRRGSAFSRIDVADRQALVTVVPVTL